MILPASCIEQRAFELAQRSVALDPSLPYGHVQLAYLYVYRLQHDDAIREAEQAIQLGGANYADGYAVLAQVLTYGGEPRESGSPHGEGPELWTRRRRSSTSANSARPIT